MIDLSEAPALQHFMVTWGVGMEFGGMTTMCLYRAEMLRKIARIEAPILTFDPVGTYDEIREKMRESGLLHPDTPLLNLYEYYRAQDFANMEPVAVVREMVGVLPWDSRTITTLDSSGCPFRSTISNLDGSKVYRRVFYRPDGSIFVTDDTPVDGDGNTSGRLISLVNTSGDVVKQYTSGSRWYRDWLDILVDSKPSVLITDSGFASRFVAKYESPNVVKAAVYHSNHVARAGDPFRGKLTPGRKHVAENPHEWDGIVFLTEQQKDDFVARFGQTNNLFTVNNPRPRLRASPDPALRERNRGVMLCRLEPVKNVEAAIEIIDRVRPFIPDIRLDVYGDGALKTELHELINRRGLDAHVRLMGFVRNAVDELQTASFSLLTSKYEGQPLSVMESQARGCPPVAFDVRYGPGELIQDGCNGFLVGDGDVEAAAKRVVELCNDPDKCADIGKRAWESSKRFDDQAVLGAWQELIETMWRQRDQTTTLGDVKFAMNRLDVNRDGSLAVEGTVSWDESTIGMDSSAPTIVLQVLPRATGRPSVQPVNATRLGESKVSVSFVFDPASLDEKVTDGNEHVDLYIRSIKANARSVIRLPFGSQFDAFRPYPTQHSYTSFKVFD